VLGRAGPIALANSVVRAVNCVAGRRPIG